MPLLVIKCNLIDKTLLSRILVVGLIPGLISCQDSRFITPPRQNFGTTLNSQTAEGNPNFSYNGRYLVFTSDRHNKRSIFLYDLHNRHFHPLPGLNQPSSIQEQADVSADGRYIVYVSQERGKTDIFIYDRQTLSTQNITKNLVGEVRHPTISGNGRLIAFESNRSGQWDLEIYDRGLNTQISIPQDSPGTPDSPKKLDN